jgi:hypothetical protein
MNTLDTGKKASCASRSDSCTVCQYADEFELYFMMDGGTKRETLFTAAIAAIAGDLEKNCVTAAAAERGLNLALSRLQTETRPVPSTSTQTVPSSSTDEIDSRHLPTFADTMSKFSAAHTDAGQTSSSQLRWKKLSSLTKVASALSADPNVAGLEKEAPLPASIDASLQIGDIPTSEVQAYETNSSAGTRETDSGNLLRPALVADVESSVDQQYDQELFSSILAAQTVSSSIIHTEESRRIQSGQKASVALRPSVVLLKLSPPPVSTPRFGGEAWLYSANDLSILRTNRPSDASGTKLSEDQYYKYVNIDPSTLDAHVRACYRVYFGEQVSVLRPSGRVIPSGSVQEVEHLNNHQECDILQSARLKAMKPFLPYSSWQKQFYVNLETKMNSNDPFETTFSDPRTRMLIQFQSLQMKLLQHPDFQGVEPLFATAYVFSTGNNVGRRVR